MKKNTIIRNFARRFAAWLHDMLEQKGQHLETCAWYPSPCQTEFPY